MYEDWFGEQSNPVLARKRGDPTCKSLEPKWLRRREGGGRSEEEESESRESPQGTKHRSAASPYSRLIVSSRSHTRHIAHAAHCF